MGALIFEVGSKQSNTFSSSVLAAKLHFFVYQYRELELIVPNQAQHPDNRCRVSASFHRGACTCFAVSLVADVLGYSVGRAAGDGTCGAGGKNNLLASLLLPAGYKQRKVSRLLISLTVKLNGENNSLLYRLAIGVFVLWSVH